jgi:hypothetical protein
MDSGRLRFPRLNLARSGMTQLTIFGNYELNENRLGLLPARSDASSKEQPERTMFNLTKYRSRGSFSAPHAIGAMSHSDNNSEEIHVSISYRQTAAGGSLRGSVPVAEGRFLNAVKAMGVPKEAGGLVLFEYRDREPGQLWFPLPVTLAGKSAEEIIEIRGVRGAKLATEGADSEYEFILDRPDNERVVLQIELNLQEPIDAETPRRLFDRAEIIARDLVASS